MARYLSPPEFSETALRVLVYDYLLEPDLHLRSRIRDLLVSHARSHPELLDALAHMNRETWRLIISASRGASSTDAENRLDQLVATLELTKEAISAVLRTWPVEAAAGRRSTPPVDLSGTRLDGTDLSGASLVGTGLRWTSLSFCNLYRAQMTNCDMSFAVLVGAHMEKAQIYPSRVDHAVFLRAGFKNTELRFPEKDDISVYLSSADGISFSDERTRRVVDDHLLDFEDVGFSICMERELTWPGLWVPSRQGYLAAIWESEVDGEIVEAKMYLDNKNSLRRRDSSDRNDGE